MSWMSGIDLMEVIVRFAKTHVESPRERRALYADLISEWKERGCDCLAGLVGMDNAFDCALALIHPEWWHGSEISDDYDGPACFSGPAPSLDAGALKNGGDQ